MAKLYALVAAALLVSATPGDPIAGIYDGSQMEIAAGMELREDGRFDYGLAYGALDETASGRWTRQGDRVLLTSDPVKAPQFTLLDQRQGAPASLEVELEKAEQLPLGLFDVAVIYKSGRMQIEQLSSEGLPFEPADPPVSLFLVLPIFDVAGDPVPIVPGKGYRLYFRFEPNDLGKIDFRDTALTIDHGDLLLERHDRQLRFRRSSR